MPNIGEVELIGATARELLRSGFAGRVLAVVTGAVYLQSETRSLGENGFIVWLAQSHLPMHTRTVRGDFHLSMIRAGMTFQFDLTELRFENQFAIQFADARAWQPPTIDPTRVVPRESVMVRAHELQDPKGFAKPFGSLRELVGLGEGLTPGGDDFIGGVLFARWHLHRAYPGTTSLDQHTVDALIEYARTRTNVISHAILRDHAAGQSVEPMHRLMVALSHGESRDAIMPHVHNLIGIGHTSGQEMLAGLITGILQNTQ